MKQRLRHLPFIRDKLAVAQSSMETAIPCVLRHKIRNEYLKPRTKVKDVIQKAGEVKSQWVENLARTKKKLQMDQKRLKML